MDTSQFSILGESLIAESIEALESQASSQPFSPNLLDAETVELWQRSIGMQTEALVTQDLHIDGNFTLEQLNLLKGDCKCACHLFRNGHLSEETPCQVCCLENSDVTGSMSDMVSQSRPSLRTSRHLSNGSESNKITVTPPNSVVSDNYSDEVIVLSQSGTPPYPPPRVPELTSRGPDWIWDWNSRPEARPPKGWPMDASPDYSSQEDALSRKIHISGLICTHVLALLLGIYIGRRIRSS